MSPLRTFFATFAAFSMSAKKPSPRLRIGRFQYLTVLFLTFFCLPSMAEAQTERSCQVNPEQVSPLLQMHQPQGRIFEDQVAQFIENQRLKKSQLGKTAEQTDETIRIPIIVHIIHAGEKIGEGANISREQVYSQIEVLNEDFNRRNADARNTPAQFLPVAAALNVEFVPATLDPEGLPLAEAGIHRYNACRTLWTPSNFEAEVKPKTIWNPDQYLNIWTVAFQRGIYGFGQFPNSSHLEGLSENEGQARTDGVMINYRNFGSILKVRTPQLLDGEPNNLGRTATHEIGHFLGLIHIWGDTNCGNDYCQDTPTHQNSNSGCPSHPKPNNCGTNDEMFENFMDYSHDVCMNIFTKNQVERMEAVLSISPRRKTLKDSDRAADLSERVFALFKSEKSKACQGQAIRFQEDVRLFDAADAVISYHWTFQNGSPATSTAPNPLVSYANAGTFSVTLSVQTRLGKTHTHNSTITIESPATAQVNPEQGFENRRLENGWQAEGWNFASLGSSSNVSMVADNFTTLYCGENHPILESPQVLLPANRLLKIDFDLAYTARSSDFTDSLEIAFSTDCGGTYQVIWKRGGSSLMTAPAQNGVFSPRPQDWRTQSAYLYVEDLSISSVQIRFRNIGRRVNNLYLDNIRIANMEDLRPPLADFEADYTTLLTNESLNLTNLSENSFEYLWQITGSRSILSEEENPSVLLSEAGNYDVSLTAKNPLGTNQVSRPNYVRVIQGAKLRNIAGQSLLVRTNNEGYVAGHNQNQDLAKAEFFGNFGTYRTLIGADVHLGALEETDENEVVTLKVWLNDGENGQPNTEVYRQLIPVSQLKRDYTRQRFSRLLFNNGAGISAPTKFYIGLELDYTQSTRLAIFTANVSQNTGWERRADGTWLPYDIPTAQGGKGISVSHAIYALVTPDQPLSSPSDEIAKRVSLFPNPTQDRIQIQGENFRVKKVLIFNSLGQLQLTAEAEREINLKRLAAGVYVARIFTDEGVVVKKLVKN